MRLLELIIVLAIIAILMGMAIDAYSDIVECIDAIKLYKIY